MSELVGVNPPRHYTIYNGVDVNHFKPVDDVESVRKILGLANRTVVLYVGRLTRSKGLEYLIRCIPEVRREIRNLTLVICGKGESREPLAKEVSTLGLQDIVEFRGEVSEQLLPLYYGASNVVVLPSLFEAMPIVLLEAMSMARPLVASNVGGVPEVVQDGVTGLLVPPQDPSALARAIVTVGADGELARNLGANGQKLVEEKFTWDSVADQTLRVYGTTLGC
jgi:glycosyltransferase involved in cell wall biosynthesis